MRILIFLSILLLTSLQTLAVPATVVTEEAIVYSKPDFDAEVMENLSEGDKIDVSQKNFGPFHRVRLANGKMGYIADNDFIMKGMKQTPAEASAKQSVVLEKKEAQIAEKVEKSRPKKYSLARSQLWGPNFSYVVYRESTLGIYPSQKSFFFGAKFTGPNFFIEGDTYSEANIMLRNGAPEFYAQATGIASRGWIFMPDVMIQNVQPQTKNVMTSYGYGLMFRYSKYDVGLSNGAGGVNFYSLEDMVVGAVANAGFFFRLGQMTLRGEYKLYMEKVTYWGLGLSLLFPF